MGGGTGSREGLDWLAKVVAGLIPRFGEGDLMGNQLVSSCDLSLQSSYVLNQARSVQRMW